MDSQHAIQFSNKAKAALLAITFVLTIPLLYSAKTDPVERSQWEKRPLHQWPAIEQTPDTKHYFNAVERYIDDHIGLALKFNKLYRKMLYYVFADSPILNVSVGKSHYTYLNSHDPKNANDIFRTVCRRGMNQELIPRREQQTITIFQALEKRGYRVSFAIPISKPVLYPENLPNNIPLEMRNHCERYSQTINIPSAISQRFSGQRTVYHPFDLIAAHKNEAHFYPKQNFHWSGKSAHIFSAGFLQAIGIKTNAVYEVEPKLVETEADLTSIGFTRTIPVWHYDYSDFGITHSHQKPDTVMTYYKDAHDFNQFTATQPLSDRSALMISNSFGVFTAPHIAPGFKTLYHVNVNHLKKAERQGFYFDFIDSLNVTDIIFLMHDGGYINGIPLLATHAALKPKPKKARQKNVTVLPEQQTKTL